VGKLKTVFAQKGSVTAGNSSQMSDGAVRVAVQRSALKRYNLTPIGKFLGFSVAGVRRRSWHRPKEAIPRVLKQWA